MATADFNKVISTTGISEALQTDIVSAAELAYQTIADRKDLPPEEISKMRVCYKAAELMVGSLRGNGHKVEHELRGGWTVLVHSYVTLDTHGGEEIIIDPTWQQYLPEEKMTSEVPKVLVGTRSAVISQARYFGVDETALSLWEKPIVKMIHV